MSKSKSNGILNNYLKNRKTQKGITLTVLVITIIVILILVGVSVTVAIKGGLFEKAK